MIYTGENKAVLCKGNFHPAQLYKGDKKIAGYTETEFEGAGGITLENCYNDKIYDMHIDGVTDAAITARGKNILDMSKQTVSQGYYLDSSGGASSSNTKFIKISPIEVKPLTTYTISSNLCFYTIWFFYGGNSIKQLTAYDLFTKTFTTPENCNYIRVSLDLRATNQVGEGVSAYKWAMLEKGKGDGIYESYVKPQTIPFENGNITEDIPTFKGTTVIEIESDIAATISGKYKRKE